MRWAHGILLIALASVLLGPVAGAADAPAWFIQALPAAPAADADAVVIVEAPPGAAPRQQRTVVLLGGRDEWYACGRLATLPAGAAAALLYTRLDGQRQRVPLARPVETAVSRPFDVVLALDASHSMRDNDPDDLRVAALMRFLALARRSPAIHSLSLIVFRTEAQTVLDRADPRMLGAGTEAAIARMLTPRGSTDYDPPFDTAATLLAQRPEHEATRPAVLFLSDGRPVRRYRDGHRKLAGRDCPVYTIGLSADADANLLGRIAGESGGAFFPAPAAAELEAVFAKIFHLISAPEDIVWTGVAAAGRSAVPFVVDPGMRNINLVVAPLSGALSAALDGAALPATAAGALLSHAVEPARLGRHEVLLAGEGRASVRVQAETPHGLRVLAVPAEAPAGTPISLALFLTGDGDVADLRAACELRNPAGNTVPVTLSRNDFGLFIAHTAQTAEAGAYEVALTLTGTLQGAPLERRRTLTVARTGIAGPAHTPATKLDMVIPAAPPASPRPAPGLPVLPTAPDIAAAAPGETLWTSAADLLIEVAPGREQTTTLDVQFNGKALDPSLRAELIHDAPVEGLDLSLELARPSPQRLRATVRCAAGTATAGQQAAARLRVGTEALPREIPVAVRVAAPSLRAHLAPFTVERRGRRRLVEGRLFVGLGSDGRCEVEVSASDPDLRPLPRRLEVTADEVEIPLGLAVPAGTGPRRFAGTLTVSGPGLSPIELDYGFALAGDAAPEIAAGRTGLLTWIFLALAALLLLALAAASLRGNQRAAFILLSALLHAVALLIIMPRAPPREDAAAPSGPLSFSDAPAVVDETIPAESPAAAATASEAAPATSDKAETALPVPERSASQDLPPREHAVETPAPDTLPLDPDRVARPELQPETLAAAEAAPPERRSETAEPTPAETLAATPTKASPVETALADARSRQLAADSANTAFSAPVPSAVPPHREAPAPLTALGEAGPPAAATARQPKRRADSTDPEGTAAAAASGQAPAVTVAAVAPTVAAGEGAGVAVRLPALAAPGAGAALVGIEDRLTLSLPGAELADVGEPGTSPATSERRQGAPVPAASARPVEGASGGPVRVTTAPAASGASARVLAPAPAAAPEPAAGAGPKPRGVALPRIGVPAARLADPTTAPATAPVPRAEAGRTDGQTTLADALPSNGQATRPATPSARPDGGHARLAVALPPPKVVPPPATPLPVGRLQTELPAGGGAGRAGEWRRTFANLQHGGDWDCDRTAMLNLAHQFERRTGSLFPFQSRAVAVTDAESLKAPFLFMSGHTPVEFTEPEAKALRAYLEGGGYLWINDSTDLGDDAFDGSVRRQLARLFPGAELKPIPMNHPIFAGPYDLSGGFRGFQVPPGDKYRSDHLEGLWLDGRLAVVYTRNDYGDGLEIDLKTAPLMQSLTDLTPLEMQEASIQMGINLASYFINRGRPVTGRLTASLPPGDGVAPVRPPPEAARTAWLDDPAEWRAPREDSPDYLRVVSVRAAAPPRLGISVTFDDGGKPFLPRRSKVILDRDGPLALDGRTVLVLAVHSRLAGGAQVALGFSGTGPVPYLETAAAFVRPGHSRELVFDLRRPILKSEQNEWRADGAFPEGFAVQTLHLLVYPQSPSGTIDCTEIRIAAPPAP